MTYKRVLDRRITDNGIQYYRPHTKQASFHRSRLRNRWVFGGNRTGKTVAGAVEAVWYATGLHPYKTIKPPTRGWVVSLTNEVQRDVAQHEILKWLPRDMIKDVQMRKGKKDNLRTGIIDFIELSNGSVIGFKSCEQGREKCQGTSQHWIWYDEEPPEDIYAECRMRVLDTGGDMWGTMTPLQGLTWVYDTIYLNEIGDKDVAYWLIEWADNPHLSADMIAHLESTLTDDEREARQYGKFIAMSGLVYKEFAEDIHVIDPFNVPRDWYDNISIDPGLDAPLSAHFYAVDGDNNLYVVAEHYKAGESVEWHAERLHAIADQLEWPRNHLGMLECLIDSAASQRTLAAERSVVDLLHDNRIMADTKVTKDVWTGIQRVKQYLRLREHPQVEVWPRGKPKLFIFRTCTNLIREIKSYRWRPQTASGDQTDRPIKRDDHAMDDLRYYIMSRPDLGKYDHVDPSRRQISASALPFALQDDPERELWTDL